MSQYRNEAQIELRTHEIVDKLLAAERMRVFGVEVTGNGFATHNLKDSARYAEFMVKDAVRKTSLLLSAMSLPLDPAGQSLQSQASMLESKAAYAEARAASYRATAEALKAAAKQLK